MSGVIPRNLKQKRRFYLKPFSWGPQTWHTHTLTHRHTHTHARTHARTHAHTHARTHTHTHTHDDSIRRNAMRCISPKNIHKLLGADLDATDLSLEYDELFAVDNIEDIQKITLSELVSFLASSDSYKNVTTVMSRILAAKPHSADVERWISTSRILKTIKRSSLLVDTENAYLYFYHSMPPLVEWDPRLAVLLWLKKRERREKSIPKGKEQAWFHSKFSQSSKRQASDELNDENASRAKKRKFWDNYFKSNLKDCVTIGRVYYIIIIIIETFVQWYQCIFLLAM